MNHDPTEIRMRELNWRHILTATERAEFDAWRAGHPEAAAQWQVEATLNSLLERLPNAPVPSNFTARVMQKLARDDARAESTNPQARPWWQRILLPRLAFLAVLLGAGLFVHERNIAIKQERETAGLLAVSGTEKVLSVEVLQNFDAIDQLGPRVQPDTELLSLMQ